MKKRLSVTATTAGTCALALQGNVVAVSYAGTSVAANTDRGKVDRPRVDVEGGTYQALYNPLTRVAVSATYTAGNIGCLVINNTHRYLFGAVVGATVR